MLKKKENLLTKFVQKDYNNELEKVLETKQFNSNVKNLLLEILYKIEAAYNDYKEVKRDVDTKKEYIQKLINIIQNKCNEIITVKLGTEECKQLGTKTFIVDKENKTIISYPIEIKLLYCLFKIDKKDIITKSNITLLNIAISDLINVGNNINMVEPLRNFNGWSWAIIPKEIENIEYNLVYQNLRILLGNSFLNNWVENDEYLIDYFELMNNMLEEKFGSENQEKLNKALKNISILMQIKINPTLKEQYDEIKAKLYEELLNLSDKKKYIEKIMEEKKQIKQDLKELEAIISDKQKLQIEYKKRNEKLPLEKKIFSMKVLNKILLEEKKDLKLKLEEKNKCLNPSNYIKKKNETQEMLEILEYGDIKQKMIEFQEIFLDCLIILITNAQTREDIINLVYSLRYYCKIPLTNDEEILANANLKEKLQNVIFKLFEKAKTDKVINENITFDIFKYIMNSKVIELQTMYVEVKKTSKSIILQFSEDSEDGYEEKLEIEREELHENNIFRGNKNGYRFKLFS